jgi:hypothetical protein
MTAEPEIYELMRAIWGPVAGDQGRPQRPKLPPAQPAAADSNINSQNQNAR